MNKILITLDGNERGSERAKALALAVGGDPAYALAGFGDLPIDMQLRGEQLFTCGPNHEAIPAKPCIVNVELKEIHDFWSSKNTGHLGQQLVEMIAQGEPGFVAVFGSLQEILDAVPKVKTTCNPSGMMKAQARSQMDIDSDLNTARAFCADAAACNVPVHFLSSNHEQSFRWILSYAKHILAGPNLASWLPRMPVEPRGYACLCAINGIGDVAARGLLATYGDIWQIAHEAALNFDGLAATKINGKALGPAKARKIAEVLG